MDSKYLHYPTFSVLDISSAAFLNRYPLFLLDDPSGGRDRQKPFIVGS